MIADEPIYSITSKITTTDALKTLYVLNLFLIPNCPTVGVHLTEKNTLLPFVVFRAFRGHEKRNLRVIEIGKVAKRSRPLGARAPRPQSKRRRFLPDWNHESTRIDVNQDSCLPSCAFVVLKILVTIQDPSAFHHRDIEGMEIKKDSSVYSPW